MLALAAALTLVATPALAHGPFATPGRFETACLLLLVATGALYARGLRGGRGARRRAVLFAAAWASLFLSLVWPLPQIDDASFAGHMLEHQILTLLSAPLLALARPLPTLLRGLPRGLRRPPAWARSAAERASRPVAAMFLHGAALWIWHAPGPFEAALTNDLVHGLEHASFLLTGIAFWWAMLVSRRRGAAALSILLLFATAAHTAALSALITFAPTVWYGSYGDLADQQLAGVLMWALGGTAYPAAALARVLRLVRRSERQGGRLGAA